MNNASKKYILDTNQMCKLYESSLREKDKVNSILTNEHDKIAVESVIGSDYHRMDSSNKVDYNFEYGTIHANIRKLIDVFIYNEV